MTGAAGTPLRPAHDPRHVGGAAAVHRGRRGRLARVRVAARTHGRGRPRARGEHGHRLRAAARRRHPRPRARDSRHAQRGAGRLRGRRVRRRRARCAVRPRRVPRARWTRSARAAARRSCSRRTASTRWTTTEWVAAHDAFGRRFDRFIGFELGPMFVPYGRIYSLAAYEGLLGVASCIGAKHSSLSRAAEWDRLALRDRVRPDFHVFTGNDLAIDMVCYGSDYLLGLSAFAPEAFAERDRRWAAGDRVVPRAQRPAAVPRRLRVPRAGARLPPRRRAVPAAPRPDRVATPRPPGAPRRPDSDRAVLADIAERLEALL